MTGVARTFLNSTIPRENYGEWHVVFSIIDVPKGVVCTSLLDDEKEAIIYGCPYDYRYGLNLVKNDISYMALLSKEDLELGKRFCAISKDDAHEIGVDIPNWDGNGKWRNLITVDTSAHMRALYRVRQFNEACLTPSEVSAILSIDYNTICKWCRDGVIKSYMGHSGQGCGSRAIFYEDFKAFIFNHPKKWNRVQDGEVNDKKRRYKIRYLMCGILRNPGKKRFYDLYLNECRRLTYESEGF